MYQQYFNQFITPDLRNGTKIPLPGYTDNMYDRLGKEVRTGEVYSTYVNRLCITLNWVSTQKRFQKDLPSMVDITHDGIVGAVSYTVPDVDNVYNHAFHRLCGPAVLYESGAKGWFMDDTFYHRGDYATRDFLNMLFIQNKTEVVIDAIEKMHSYGYLDLDDAYQYVKGGNHSSINKSKLMATLEKLKNK